MATFSQKDIQLVFIGAEAATTTGAIDAMNDGEIGIFTPAGARITEATAATTEKFIIVKKTPNGGVPLLSSIINKKDLKAVVRKAYDPAVAKVHTVGYDGANGSLEAINDNNYILRLNLRAEYVDNHGGLYVKHGFHKSTAAATEYEVVTNLLRNIQASLSKEPTDRVLVEMLADDAGVATTGTVSVVKGSKTFVTTVPGNFAVGGLVRLGNATTDDTYKIVSIVGNNITLDTKVTAVTQTFAIGAAESVSQANAIAATYGLRFTGLEEPHVIGKLHNDLMAQDFDVTLENFGTTTNVTVNGAYAGSGTERQVQELEWFAQGNEGDFQRMGEPNIYPSRAEASGNYDLIDLQIEELSTGSITTGPIHRAYTLAIPETAPSYAVAGTPNDITDVLEVLAFGALNGDLTIT